jgi:hypothetical protein
MVSPLKHWWTETCRFCQWIDHIVGFSLRLLVLGLSIYGGYLLLYWIQDTSPVVIFEMGEVSPATGRPGDTLVFYQPIRKTHTCWGVVRRIMVGDCGLFIISESSTWLPAPWHGRLTYAVKIPQEAIPGPCGFQVIARFVCNPFDFVGQQRLVASTPIQFQVLRYDQ